MTPDTIVSSFFVVGFQRFTPDPVSGGVVPAAAGVMDLWAELHAMLLPVLIALVPVTFLVMATAGRVTQRFAKAEPELEEELANDDAQ